MIQTTDPIRHLFLLLKEEGTRDHMVRILKDAGADVNMKDRNGCTALIHACEQRCNDIVRILVQHCNINPDIEDIDENKNPARKSRPPQSSCLRELNKEKTKCVIQINSVRYSLVEKYSHKHRDIQTLEG
nr:synphilin-1-like [Biomphalaria glabrata]